MSDKKKSPFLFEVFPADKGEITDWLTRSAVTLQFDAIVQHVDFLNQSIIQEKKQLKIMAEQYVESMDIQDEHEKNSFYHAFINNGALPLDYEYSAINSFPQIQWRSEFLVAYSVFEHTLNSLCKIVQRKSGFTKGIDAIKGKGFGIARAEEYFKTVVNVEIPISTTDLERIKFLAKIRNIITHNNSEFNSKKEPLSAALKKEDPAIQLILLVNGDLEILLSYDFVKKSIFELQSVILKICNYKLYKNIAK